ncbi:probable pectate lyase 5 [Telopea speciosissima]|uniref:probable pectate lyase 5 n=1 Tax=Telopea speciosissima TaxID=54955 RepID=UPI001CC4B11A|nr:probable pectate lyase 5 [Telopea speciosissima]
MLYILFIFLLSFLSSLTNATLNLTLLPHEHPDPEAIVQEVQWKVKEYLSRKQLMSIHEKDQTIVCPTGNPVDDCWRCDPNWASNRQHLADCGIGFGRDALGGKGGATYIVTDSSDALKPGTFRYGVSLNQPLWIIFSGDMTIKLKDKLLMSSFMTVDGRGANVHIVGAGCLIIEQVRNVIIHNIHIHDCVPAKSDGDGITIKESSRIWVDHCTLSSCTDGLIDVTHGSTGITISNNHFSHHDKVMLLGHSDDFVADSGMQVTVALNHFGEGLEQRMPRCRHGYFHVVNNDYTEWGMYAVGGSTNPTINSQGNRYIAPANPNAKEVTRRLDTVGKSEWLKWDWRSEGDMLVNGAFFVPSGDGAGVKYALASSTEPKSPMMIDQLTMNAGVISGPTVPTPIGGSRPVSDPGTGTGTGTGVGASTGLDTGSGTGWGPFVGGGTGSLFSTVPILSRDNYKKWKEDMDVTLCLMELGLAFKEPKPIVTASNTTDEKQKLKKWETTHKKCITPMKKSILETMKDSMEKMDTATEYLAAIKEVFEDCKAEARLYNPHERVLDSRTVSCFFMGYPERSKGYRFYCLSSINKIVETNHAKFIENGDELPKPCNLDFDEDRTVTFDVVPSTILQLSTTTVDEVAFDLLRR